MTRDFSAFYKSLSLNDYCAKSVWYYNGGMKKEYFSLIHEIKDATTVDDVYGIVQQLVTALGFDCYLHGMKIRLAVSRPLVVVASSFPDSWSYQYQTNHYEAVDPLVAHAFLNLSPAIWSQYRRLNEALFDEAASHGLHDGIVIPIFGSGGDQGMFSVATKNPGLDVSSLDDLHEIIATLHYTVPYLYESTSKMLKTDMCNDSSLTQREKTCLLWTADGKSAQEVAQILDVSERTVRFHIKNASTKLGTNSGVQAVTRAISAGAFDGVPANFDLKWDQHE